MSKIFLTGITGFVGGSVAVRLREAGHQVTGLARKAQDVQTLRALGYEMVHGDLHDAAVLRSAIEGADAVIHAAECDDPQIAQTLITCLEGRGKKFIYTSGSGILANWTQPETASFVYTEDFPLPQEGPMGRRVAINNTVLRSALRGIHAMVIVPSMVYGQGRLLKKDSAQIPALMRAARQMGAGVYVGTGAHCWSNVHVDDLADLFLLMLERARPGTCTFAENGIASFRELAQAIHHRFGLPGEPRSLTPSEASELWGPMMSTIALGSDCRMSANKARKVLGWAPRHGAVVQAI